MQRIYPEVWRDICQLAAKTHLCLDLDSGLVRHRDRRNHWKPLPNPPEGERLLEILRVISALPKRPFDPGGTFAVVLLAGGSSSRFGQGNTQKILHAVKGIPAIERLVDRCREAGCGPIVVVVGQYWQEVVDFLESRYHDIHYVYQPEPRGTGDAARIGARYLESHNFEGELLVLAGDKVLSRDAIPQLLQSHHVAKACMTMAVADKKAWPGSGRVVFDGCDKVVAVIEQPDIARDRILKILDTWPHDIIRSDEFLAKADAIQPDCQKLRKCLGTDLWKFLAESGPIDRLSLRERLHSIPRGIRVCHADGEEQIFEGDDIEARCDLVNVSLYLFQASLLYQALKAIQDQNAQHEYYLTDVVQIMADRSKLNSHGPVVACRLDDFAAAGFNTLQELAAIEAHLQD